MAPALTSQSAAYSDDAAEATVVRAEREHEKYERLIARAKGIAPIPIAVVWPCEAHALAGPVEGVREKIVAPVLVGPESRIRSVAAEADLDLGGCQIVDAASEEEAAATAVRLVREGRAHSLMSACTRT